MKKTRNRIFGVCVFFLMVMSIATQAQKRELWGMTTGGAGGGTIFKTDSMGNNMKLVYRFEKQGKQPMKSFVQHANGKLYSVASGGNYGAGVLFEFDQYNIVYANKVDFKDDSTGMNPSSRLLLASNGKLYGVCQMGGKYKRGVIYEYNPLTDSLRVIHHFDTLGYGGYPQNGLMQASNGKFYGLITSYSYNTHGVLYEYDLSTNTYSTKVVFSDANALRPNIGAQPIGELVEVASGKLYGMTQYGGQNTQVNGGVIFEYDFIQDTLIIKHSFNVAASLYMQLGTLALSNGKLYGMSATTIFEFNLQNNQYVVKHTLNYANSTNGFLLVDRLVKGSNGKFYGLSMYGGAYNQGVLFEFNPQNGQYTKMVDLQSLTKGAHPQGGLFLASNGIFYGMTRQGGIAGQGIIFEYNNNSTNIFIKRYDFTTAVNGCNPNGSLLLASNGKFYGMTSLGGANDCGVLFEFDPATYTYTKKVDFSGLVGRNPHGSLIEASNGKIYGMTSNGTNSAKGSLFEYDILNDSISVKKFFYGGNFGGNPYGDMVEGDSGSLYGMTSTYWSNHGVIFEYNMQTGVCTSHSGFGYGGINARNPFGTLVKDNNALLYGTTKNGGAYNKGTLFAFYTASNTTGLKVNFNGSNGANPTGNLCKATNGKYYGLTTSGGAYNCGVLYEYSGVYFSKKVDFKSDSIGDTPYGSLMLSSNGRLYGMTYMGGNYNKGVLFEYYPGTGLVVVKHHFDGAMGAFPKYTTLVEYDACANASYHTINALVCDHYVSPSGKIWTHSGTYQDTVSSLIFCDSIITVNLIVSHIDTSVTKTGASLIANFNNGTYQWLDCNNAYSPIQGANSQSFTPSVNGNYAVMIQGNGCVDTSACITVNTVGMVENTFESSINIYPNPTDGVLHLEFSTVMESIDLVLRNAIGRVEIREHYENTNSLNFHIEGAAGLYLLELTNSHGKRVVVRIVKN